MVALFWLLGCVVAPAQPGSSSTPAAPTYPESRAVWTGEQVLTPRLARRQELVYRGTFTEQSTSSRVQFQRTYRLTARFFVLDTPPKGINLVAFTTLQDRASRTVKPGVSLEPMSNSIRMERLALDLQSRITADPSVSLTVPLDGPPTLEVGAFLSIPSGRAAARDGWETVEPNRPPTAWRIAGVEAIAGQNCIKVIGVQQTDEWAHPRGDRGAWRRQDTVWVTTRTGLSARVERIIEQREPACRETSQKSVLRYDLESSLLLPAQLAQDRRQEVLQAFAFREAARPMVVSPGQYHIQLDTLKRRINSQLENHPTTPYREAILLVKQQVEAALHGEVVSVVHQQSAPPAVATLGEAAPEFVASECTGNGSGQLSHWKGKPVLLVFYHPDSCTAAELLHFAQEVHTTYGKLAHVVGLAVVDDATPVLKQRTALKLGFPILHGNGLRINYAVETTPKMVLIDSVGVVRGMYVGWGHETAGEVLSELRRWLPR